MSALTRILDRDWPVLLLIFGVILLSSIVDCDADAQSRSKASIPTDQLTPRTQVWLARGMVSEAGWKAKTDHAAIAHILARRWKARQLRWPGVTFEQIIRHYCAGFYIKESALTPRQQWIRQLVPSGAEPAAWPRKYVRWDKHLPYWNEALRRAELFGRAERPVPR
jgi:hypothetical protein